MRRFIFFNFYWLVVVNNCLAIKINLISSLSINLSVFYVTCISFASVQHSFQRVPLCNGVL